VLRLAHRDRDTRSSWSRPTHAFVVAIRRLAALAATSVNSEVTQ